MGGRDQDRGHQGRVRLAGWSGLTCSQTCNGTQSTSASPVCLVQMTGIKKKNVHSNAIVANEHFFCYTYANDPALAWVGRTGKQDRPVQR
jgi:hypothetical protein